ncbi:glucose PTS transporter transcription antiterminator GlcT [Neobacillus sp. D3-1R]|uniref:glucose PTS transporter transcription antiterminator GlcT n=1 Tax=Neobacillus sp. D3-1R TaxID=3445778 RepID=UPI003FA1303B
MVELTVKKVLNNNVLIADHLNYGEVIVIGNGIGFNRKKGDELSAEAIEKLFVLTNEREQTNYLKLLPFIEDKTQKVIISAVELIKQKMQSPLYEHIHVAFTDHLLFAINRIKNGLELGNPFLMETKTLYPEEYTIALEVVNLINHQLNLSLPEGEAGFIALHIHSAVTNKNISEVNQYNQLISRLIDMVEEKFQFTIDKESIDYMRLVRHLRFTIERVKNEEIVKEPEKIALLLKNEYPVCYNLSWKLIKVMQQALQKPIYDAEAVYLTMHLQRLQNKHE